MYNVIGIGNITKVGQSYIKMNTNSMDIATARDLVKALPETMEPKIIDELKTELAIKLNNKLKGFVGSGSYLLDKHNRDTQAFAYKSSAMKIDGEWVGTCKDPVGGTFKTSKKAV